MGTQYLLQNLGVTTVINLVVKIRIIMRVIF
jgi:hypothetical protein